MALLLRLAVGSLLAGWLILAGGRSAAAQDLPACLEPNLPIVRDFDPMPRPEAIEPACGAGGCVDQGPPAVMFGAADYSIYDGDSCQQCAEDYHRWDSLGCLGWWIRDLSVFAGVHGFKGPFDQGRNGNFGIHEGLNLGALLVDLPDLLGGHMGYQLGFEAAQSNFAGDQTTTMIRTADRNQFFFTGGVFHRSLDGGCQNGVVYDVLWDNYYANVVLKQIRSDSSFVLPGGKRELGYFGAYGTGGHTFVLLDRRTTTMQPTDVFAIYYRRYFEGGGDGRIWGGMSGRGDGIVGAEIRAPIGKDWALANRFNYLIPKHGGAEGLSRESWGLVVELVWYPGQLARCVRCSPYRPMLNVADNTLFMTDTFVGPP